MSQRVLFEVVQIAVTQLFQSSSNILTVKSEIISTRWRNKDRFRRSMDHYKNEQVVWILISSVQQISHLIMIQISNRNGQICVRFIRFVPHQLYRNLSRFVFRWR